MRLFCLLVSAVFVLSVPIISTASATAGSAEPSALGVVAGTSDPTSPVTPTGTPSVPVRKAASDYPGPRPQDPFTFLDLDQCRAETAGHQEFAEELRGFAFNHFQWCASTKITLLTNDVNDGSLIGAVQFRATFLAQAPENDRQFTTQILIDKGRDRWPHTMNLDNTRLQWNPSCELTELKGTCTFTPGHTEPQSIRYLQDHPQAITLRSEQTASSGNPYAIMKGLLRFTLAWSTDAGVTDPGVVPRVHQGIRCDSAGDVSGRVYGRACIFDWAGSVLHLNANDENIDETALHIRDAQNDPMNAEPKPPTGVTKSIPSILTRQWDDKLTSDQRLASKAACVKAYGTLPPNSGKDCDEFPFASTKEGSLGVAGPGQGGTNLNYSVRYVKSSDNQLSGSWVGAWYAKDRLLPDDTFRVEIFDGPHVPDQNPPPPKAQANR
ncbi:NucA/NucB deoxyribonuclease domain-containing protein [Kribbella sp. NPDC054772]